MSMYSFKWSILQIYFGKSLSEDILQKKKFGNLQHPAIL